VSKKPWRTSIHKSSSLSRGERATALAVVARTPLIATSRDQDAGLTDLIYPTRPSAAGFGVSEVLGSAGSLQHTASQHGGRSPCITESRRSNRWFGVELALPGGGRPAVGMARSVAALGPAGAVNRPADGEECRPNIRAGGEPEFSSHRPASSRLRALVTPSRQSYVPTTQ
jgi:hypothetical protein